MSGVSIRSYSFSPTRMAFLKLPHSKRDSKDKAFSLQEEKWFEHTRGKTRGFVIEMGLEG